MARTTEKNTCGQEIEVTDRFAGIFAALGEPTRLKIMQILPREPLCEQMYNVVELAEELGLTQPTVSHHLKILSEAGIVQSRRQCNSIYYYVDQAAVLEWLKQTKNASAATAVKRNDAGTRRRGDTGTSASTNHESIACLD